MRVHRRRFLHGAAALAAVGVAAPTRAADIGAAAPGFAATDTAGRRFTLDGLRGRIVVLEWSNPLCPFAGKHYASGGMQALQDETVAAGGAWFTLFSTPPDTIGYASELEAEAITEQRKARPTGILLDHDTSLARLFGARATPHLFVVARDGTLAYAGGMDSIASVRIEDIERATPYARDALRAVIAGRPVEFATTRPYGCPIKYL